MKTLMSSLICLFILLNLSSCTSYYYSVLNSNDKQIVKDNSGSLVIENDSVIVAYSFRGENAPITINIFNKLKEPLYVDWKKSAVIIDGTATSYKGDQYSIGGQSSSSTYNYSYDRRSSVTSGSFAGSVTIPHDAEFIPPQSRIVHTPLELADFSFDQVAEEHYNKKDFCKNNGDMVKIKVAGFDESNSPLNFRSYLTIYYESNPSNPIVLNNEFYISELMKAGSVSPADFAEVPNDMFFVRKEKGVTAALITTAIVITAADVATDIWLTKKAND